MNRYPSVYCSTMGREILQEVFISHKSAFYYRAVSPTRLEVP
jgi:hypothetical protein